MLPRPPPPPKEMPRGGMASWLKAALTRWALGQTLQEAGSREAVREVDEKAGGGRRQAVAPEGGSQADLSDYLNDYNCVFLLYPPWVGDFCQHTNFFFTMISYIFAFQKQYTN